MLDNNIEEMLKGLTDGEIATLIGLAYREQQDREEAKKNKIHECNQQGYSGLSG